MRFAMRTRLRIGLAAAGLALMLGAVSANADTIVGLGPSSSGAVTVVFSDQGNPIQVVLPGILSGTGYEFDSGGTATVFSPAATNLTPFAYSDQATTLSLNGGSPTPVSWVDMGGGGLPGILVLQFTTPLQSASFPYDDLILNITAISQSVPRYCGTAFYPSGCTYDSIVTSSGPTVTQTLVSLYGCGFAGLSPCYNTTITPDPITVTAGISSGEVFVGTQTTTPPTTTPEPSTLSLLVASLISTFGLAGAVRRKAFHT